MTAIFWAFLVPPDATAQDGCPPLPLIPYDLDPEAFEETPCDPEPLDQLKFIALSSEDDVFLSIGGEGRVRYEYSGNPAFGAEPNDGAFLHRYSLSADWYLGPHVRVYGELASAFAGGRSGSPGPIDENALDFQNLFVELRQEAPGGTKAFVRAGRQELQFGSGRLVSVRDGPNVRRTFDGVKAGAASGNWTVEAFVMRPRQDRSGVFDDRTSDERTLWGAYAAFADAPFLPGKTDFFYLGYDNEAARFNQGIGKETRHTFGTRFHGGEGNWDWNWEAMVQFGSFGNGDIFAWSVATDTGYTFADVPWAPRIALNANIASGDRDPEDADLQTFNPLFPRGNYFSEAAILGPNNFYNLHGFLTVHPFGNLAVTADVNSYFRLNPDDGVYASSGSVIAPGDASDRSFVGSAISLNTEYQISRNLLFTGIYSRFTPGPVLDAASPGRSVNFVEATLRFRF